MPYKANEARRHKIPRARYKVTNWPEYDRALQQRGSLTVWMTPEGVVQNLPFLGHTGARRAPAWEGRIATGRCPVREAASLSGSSALGLKRSQAQQGEPVRMALAGHQLARALALALLMPAAQEAAVVQEEAQQVQVRAAEMAAQDEVGAQARVEVLHERAAARRVGHDPAHGVEQGVELGPSA